MKYFSMFSGIGGFELGIQRAENQSVNCTNREGPTSQLPRCSLYRTGIEDNEHEKQPKSHCVGFSEVNKYAVQIYQNHFDHKNYGDATRIDPAELSDFDFLCGGFPCQAFSIAGKRGGFKDTRGTLFFEIARILSIKRPKLLLLENVKGLLSHDNGRTFGTILATLFELGYFCEWQVLNSKDFGVPQNRERVFIVGHLGSSSGREIFPISDDDKKNNELERPSKAIRATSPTLTSRGAGEYHSGMICIPVINTDRVKKSQNGRRMKENGDPSFSLTTQDRHGIYDGMQIRRLTPTECERLQGFPDGWTGGGVSDSQRYKCLGNAVTVNVIEAIVNKILKKGAL